MVWTAIEWKGKATYPYTGPEEATVDQLPFPGVRSLVERHVDSGEQPQRRGVVTDRTRKPGLICIVVGTQKISQPRASPKRPSVVARFCRFFTIPPPRSEMREARQQGSALFRIANGWALNLAVVLELFAGTGRFSAATSSHKPVLLWDILMGPGYDFADRCNQLLVLGWIRAGLVAAVP